VLGILPDVVWSVMGRYRQWVKYHQVLKSSRIDNAGRGKSRSEFARHKWCLSATTKLSPSLLVINRLYTSNRVGQDCE